MHYIKIAKHYYNIEENSKTNYSRKNMPINYNFITKRR